MKKLAFITLFVIIIVFTLLALSEIVLPQLKPSNGRLSVTVSGQEASVIMDDKEIGTTPYYSDALRVGDHKIEVKSKSNTGFTWKTNTVLGSSTLSILDLDLAESLTFSSGENLYFKSGETGLSLLTRPENSTVKLNGSEKGKAPLNLNLDSGIHLISVEKDGYLTREVPLNIEQGFRLNAVVYLSADPFYKVEKLDSTSRSSLFRLSNNKVELSKSFAGWAGGIKHIQKSFSSAETMFDLVIDPNGKTYIFNAVEWENKKSSKSVINVGYLAKKEGEILTVEAQQEWEKIKNDFQ